MKFGHLADCHIGGWKEPKLKNLSIKSFEKAIDICINEHIGFLLISGDLFDTAIPPIDLIKDVASIIHKLKEEDIPVYIIPGSHDFSPSGKTMLDVLEKTGLCENVMKIEENKLGFTIDRTGTKITGILGRKGGLEIKDYEYLENKAQLENETGFKIFMFHTLLTELKPQSLEKIETSPLSLLPKNFNYYAGGHPHFIYAKHHEGFGLITYPGPTFPNNFKELEELKQGGFYLVETNNGEIKPKHISLNLIETDSYRFNVNGKTPQQVETQIIDDVKNFENKIITLRLEGCLESGKPSEINFTQIYDKLVGAYQILKNTHKLTSKEFQEMEIDLRNVDDLEKSIIKEHEPQNKIFKNAEEIVSSLMKTLDTEKMEGEKNADFELRIVKDALSVLENVN